MALDLPFFERFKAIFADKLNRIVSELRASTIQPGIGYKVNRTPGGTTLVIDTQTGGGGGAAADYCFFKVNDVTDPDTHILRISIQPDQVEGRWPLDMDGINPLQKNIPSEYTEKKGWVALYLLLKVDEFGVILPDDNAIEFHFKPDFQKEGNCLQWFYVAGINIDIDEESNPYISRIDNACPVVYAWPINPCSFEIEDATDVSGSPQVLIRVGKVEGDYPTGMSARTHYIRSLSEISGDFATVYCRIAQKYGSVDYSVDDPISIVFFDEYKKTSDTVKYDLLGEITISYDEDGVRYISYIDNKCVNPQVSPYTEDCKFKVSDPSGGTTLDLKMQSGKVNGVFPEGMTEEDYEFNIDHIGGEFAAIYIRLHVNEYGEIYNESDAVKIFVVDQYQKSGWSYQWFLIATCTISYGSGKGNERYVSFLQNHCPDITPQASVNCPFEIDDATNDEQTQIQIKNGKILGEYPDGMYDGTPFTLTVPQDQDWFAVYSMMVIKEGQIDAGISPNRIISVQKEYKFTSDTKQWDLLGEFTTTESENGPKKLDWLMNYCVNPKLPPLPDYKCFFKVENVSTNYVQKVRVNQAQVYGVWPEEMGLGTDDFIIELDEEDIYIYVSVKWDTDYMVFRGNAGDVKIESFTEIKKNTTDTTYTLIATVELDSEGAIKFINNMCREIFPDPCLLDWSTSTSGE